MNAKFSFIPNRFEGDTIEYPVSFASDENGLIYNLSEWGESFQDEDLKHMLMHEYIEISINGTIIPVDDWCTTFLKENDEIIISPTVEGGGGGILQTILGAVLIVAGIFLLETPIGPWLIAAGASMMLGGVLQLLFAPTLPLTPTYDQGSDSPTYSWDGPQLTSISDRPIGVVYGEHALGGNVIQMYSTSDADKDYLNILIGLCEGEIEGICRADGVGITTTSGKIQTTTIEINPAWNVWEEQRVLFANQKVGAYLDYSSWIVSHPEPTKYLNSGTSGGTEVPDIRLNDQSILNYTGVEWDFRAGTSDQSTISGYDTTHTYYDVKRKVTPAGYIYTTNSDTVNEIRLKMECPSLYSTDGGGNIIENAVSYQVYHRLHGTQTWILTTTYGYGENPAWVAWNNEWLSSLAARIGTFVVDQESGTTFYNTGYPGNRDMGNGEYNLDCWKRGWMSGTGTYMYIPGWEGGSGTYEWWYSHPLSESVIVYQDSTRAVLHSTVYYNAVNVRFGTLSSGTITGHPEPSRFVSNLPMTTCEIRGKSKTKVNRTVSIPNLPSGCYDIKLVRVSPEQTDFKNSSDLYFSGIDEISYQDLAYPYTSLLSLRVLATDQISGGLPNIVTKIRGRKVRVPNLVAGGIARPYESCYSDGTNWIFPNSDNTTSICTYLPSVASWSRQWTRNPVWCFIDFLTDSRFGFGEYITDAMIDWTYAISAAKYADMPIDKLDGSSELEKRFQVDGVWDTSQGGMECFAEFCKLFRGWPIWAEGKIKFVVDKAALPVQLFNMSNIISGSYSQTFAPKSSIPTIIEVQFPDEDDDYKLKMREVVNHKAWVTGSPRTKQSITLKGISRQTHAIREAKFFLNSATYRQQAIQFKAVLDAVHCQAGDLISFQHDVAQWGYGGRVINASLTANTITVDQDLTVNVGPTYKIFYQTPAGTFVTATVTNTATSATRLLTVSPILVPTTTPVVDALYSYGVSESQKKDFKIISISREESNELSINALEYNESVYSDSGIVIPTPNYSDLPDPLARPGPVLDLTLTELSSGVGFSVSFNRPFPSTGYDHAEIHISTDGGSNYSLWGATTNTYEEIDALPGTTYYVRVYSCNARGIRNLNPPTASIYIGNLLFPEDVTGLQIFGRGNLDTFTTQDVKFTWNTAGGLLGWQVQISDSFGTIKRTELVTDNWYTYSLDKNTADNNEMPVPSLTISVWAKNVYGNLSINPAVLAVSNTVPAIIGTISSDFLGRDCIIYWDLSIDPDVVRYKLTFTGVGGSYDYYLGSNQSDFVYSYTQNVDDNATPGDPTLQLDFYAIDVFSQESVARTVTLTNPAPAMPSNFTATGMFRSVLFAWRASVEPDHKCYEFRDKIGSLGTSYTEVQPSIPNPNWICLAGDSDFTVLITGSQQNPPSVTGGRLYVSTNSGETWGEVRPLGNFNIYWRGCASDYDGNVLFACGDCTDPWTMILSKSTNYGSTWTDIRPEIDVVTPWRWNFYCVSCSSDGSVVITTNYPSVDEWTSSIFVSVNGGTTWADRTPILPAYSTSNITPRIVLSADGTTIVVGYDSATTNTPLFISNDRGLTWRTSSPPATNVPSWSVAISADGSFIIAAPGSSSSSAFIFAYTSTNSGLTWTERAIPASYKSITSVSCDATGDNLSVSTTRSGAYVVTGHVYYSYNGGETWGVASQILEPCTKCITSQVGSPILRIASIIIESSETNEFWELTDTNWSDWFELETNFYTRLLTTAEVALYGSSANIIGQVRDKDWFNQVSAAAEVDADAEPVDYPDISTEVFQFVVTDSKDSSLAELSKLYDAQLSNIGITYTPTTSDEWIQYKFPVEGLFNQVLIWTSDSLDCYVGYSRDNINWSYLRAHPDHTLDEGTKLISAISLEEAQENYWTTGTETTWMSSSASPSTSPSASPSMSPSASLSPSASVSPSASPSMSPSASLSPSASPSMSPSASLSPSASVSPSASPSVNPIIYGSYTEVYGNYTFLSGVGNLRIVIPATLLNTSSSGCKVLLGSFGTNWSFDKCYLGHAASSGDVYDFDGNQQPILFSGSASGTVPSTGNLLSDEITIEIDETKDLVFSLFKNSSLSGPRFSPTSGTLPQLYYKDGGGDESAVSNVSTYNSFWAGPGFDLISEIIIS